MIYLEEKTSILSKLIENQFPSYVQENNDKFLKFLTYYYESQERKYQPLDIVSNLVDYYNIGYFRKNQLIQFTKLTENVLTSDDTIEVESTRGFPSRNGYIKIGNEIIFYKNKTENSFKDCVRGTSALVLKNVPKAEIFLTDSKTEEHLKESSVENIAYNYAFEFFKRIKSEIAPVIPENLAEDLDISAFLKNIKSFYSSKGSLNSHRILFRILFNDRKFSVIFKDRGQGASIKINNFGGSIPDPSVVGVDPQIVNGGINYDSRKDTTGKLINPPVVDIFGSGTGKITNGIRPNKTAVIEVVDINSSGSITDIDVIDVGVNYRGPITARIRPRNFQQDQNVYSVSGTGVGKVDYYDAFKSEVVLYDVIGYFQPNDELYTIDGEKARGIIAKSYSTPVESRNGAEVISEEQNIEFPREYTFKTSDSDYINKKIIRAKLIDGYFIPDNTLPDAFNLIQDRDEIFGIPGVNIETDNFVPLNNEIYEIEISTNTDINRIYLQPTTLVTKTVTGINSSTTNFIITVDDSSRFPVKSGFVLINGREIYYDSRTLNQLIGCKYSGTETFDINIKDKVISAGRVKHDQEWTTGQSISKNDFRFYKDNLYVAESSGVSGSIPPVHTSGSERDGSLAAGDQNFVTWKYYSPNRFDYTTYIDYKNPLIVNPRFELLGMPGQFIVDEPGALHSKTKYEFARLDDPNIKVYNFTTSEISDRLSAVLGSNYNRTREVVSDNRFPSNGRLTGFSTQYDYEDYIYVASSGIPRWWDDIVDLQNPSLSTEDLKKIAFTDQKLLTRWKKSGLLYESQAFGNQQKTKKSIGLNIDAIQVNSYKGNTVNYGFIDKFIIAAGGSYPVPYTSSGSFDEQRYPALRIKNPNGSSGDLIVKNNLGLFKLSAKITKVNFNALALDPTFSNNLKNYITRPRIEVINENLRYNVTLTINSSTIDVTNRQITISSHEYNTSDIVTYFSTGSNFFTAFSDGDKFFVRKIDANTISLHKTRSDCLLNRNKVSLNNISNAANTFILLGESRNPLNFEKAELELSFTNGTIDNIVVKKSGNGYISAPTIKIIGGGKPDVVVPLVLNGERVIEMTGEIVSLKSFYLENYYEVNDVSGGIFDSTIWSINPPVTFDNGSGAAAIAYTSNGKIVSVVLIKRGSNYSLPPTIRIIGEGKDAVIESVLNSDGEIVEFKIINPGSGYKTAPRLEIEPVGSGGLVSAKLKEWTFNLKRQLTENGRIDSYGGYVYDAGDSSPSTNNPQSFTVLDYNLDFPKGIDGKQYHLFTTSEKLLAKYTEEKDLFISLYKENNPGVTLTQSQIFSISGHSPAVLVSYDGIPVYGGKKVLKVRNSSILPPTDPNYQSQFHEISSRYKLKYSTTAPTSGDYDSYTVGGQTYYVYRTGGPSVLEYPIGSFIEDYEYVKGGDDDLDDHNGRFSVTPEFPNGRYCYFTTYKSFDSVTNDIVSQSTIDFGGFPYVIGDTFASTSDDYMNNRCRTNDKVPKFFTRIFEKNVDPIPGIFPGLPANQEYPQENINQQKTIVEVDSITPGSVDSLIIEDPGDGYLVGDRLDVDNSLTFGGGFSGFVSKVVGKSITKITKSTDNKSVTFKTSQNHGLSVGDYVYFDYEKPQTPVEVYLHGNSKDPTLLSPIIIQIDDTEVNVSENESVDKYSGKLIFKINLNFRYIYRLNIPASSTYSITYDIDRVNEYFILNAGQSGVIDNIIIDVESIPNKLYLHIDNYIYELNKTRDYFGPRRIIGVDNTQNTFTINFNESTLGYEEVNISYSAKSYGASGPIKEISVSSKGTNYRSLPSIAGLIKRGTTDQPAGNGQAIIQTNSNTIGRLKNIVYDSIGGGFDSNINVNYYLNIPSTAKVINNFEIYDVEIVDGGQFYDNVTITVKENNVVKDATLKATIYLGTITNVEVVDGGSNFSTIPDLVVTADQGSGAVLKAKIRRKNIFTGFEITTQVNSELYPVPVTGKVVNFDVKTSTIEFDQLTGQFKDGNIIYTNDGRPYGKLVSIRRTRAYAKVRPYSELKTVRKDITGNTSEYLQKLTDSNYYQDWSYSIASTRDTKEWKRDQNLNTHPAGFKQFGKKLIERRKFFFTNPADVFKSSVIFTTNLINEILLKVKLSPCRKQKIYVGNPLDFDINKYFYGATSGAIGVVVKRDENFITVELRNNYQFQIGENLVEVSPEFAFGILSATEKTFIIWNGILQEPEESYEVSASYLNSVETLVPKFAIDQSDVILKYRTTTDFDLLDRKILKAGATGFSLDLENVPYPVNSSDLGEFIISIGGSVQNPSNLSVSNNVINLATKLSHDSILFAVRHKNIKQLTFTGSSTGSVFTLNYTPTDNCQLIIFSSGVFQSQLVTNFTVSGNQITFSETVNVGDIFGWYVDETVDCEILDITSLVKNKVLGVWDCTTINLTEKIESNSVKSPNSLYEIRKDVLDGSVYPASSTEVIGFDTKFRYTSPLHSSSYVEVLDAFNFNGSSKSFSLKKDGNQYIPKNGEKSLIVYIDDEILDHDQYSITGSTITFSNTYSSSKNCTLLDFVSKYSSNVDNENCDIIDRLQVQQNNSRKTFNLSDRGVPKYVNNIADLFVVKDGKLKIPSNNYVDHRNITLYSHTVNDNKITFVDSPTAVEKNEIVFFNRQLLPEPSKNVILDRLRCFDGIRSSFPITVDGILFTPINAKHLFVVRNAVMQIPDVDYTVSGSTITFTTAPEPYETVFSFYSYDGLNQNLVIDTFKYFDGVHKDFALTYNYVSSYLDRDSDIMVYRNGVYQYPGTYTVLNKQSGPYIRFDTAPLASETDKIFIINYNPTNNDDLVDITNRFYQINTTTLGYTPATPAIDSDILLIYFGGILQSYNNFIFDDVANTLTLSYPINLSTDEFRVFGFVGKKKILDEFTVQTLDSFKLYDGVQTEFALTKNYVKTIVHNTESIQVFKNGVYQQPYIDYETYVSSNSKFIIGPNDSTYIDFTVAPNVGEDIYIMNSTTDVVRDITSEFTQLTPTTIQFTGSTVIDDTVFLIFVNNLLKSSEDWTYNSSAKIITLDQPINLGSDKVTILAYTTPGKLLDSFDIVQIDSFKYFNSVNTKFPLTKNFYHEVVNNQINIHVFRNGVYQYPTKDYSIGGALDSRYIEFTTAPDKDEKVFIIHYDTSDIVDITENFRANGDTIELQYTDVSVDSPTDLLVVIDGVYQNPNTSYNTNNSIVSLTEISQNIGSTVYLYKLGDSYDLSVLDDLTGFNSSTTSFPLKKNSVAVTVLSDINIHVFRNGVYQYPSTDYTLQSDANFYYVDFTTAPSINENVFILHYETDDIVDITSSFSGVGSTSTLQYTPVAGVDTDVFVIYINGIPQPNWTYNDQTQVLTLGDSIDLGVDSVKIFAFKTKKIILQSFTIEPGILDYQLIDTSDQVSGIDTNTFLIYINGVPQYNYVYDSQSTALIFGETINLLSDYIKIFGFRTQKSMMDQFVIQSGVNSYQITDNTVPVSVTNPTDLIIFIDGVYQEPEESYTVSGSTVTFSGIDNNVGSTVYILNLGSNYSSTRLDDIDDNFTKSVFKLKDNFGDYTIYDDSDLLIYKNGTKLIPTTDFTAETAKITFASPLTETDNVIIRIKNYKLQVSGVTITTDLPVDDTELIVSVSGLIQRPSTVYTVSGDTITINDPYVITGTRYHMFQVGAEYDELDYTDDNYSKKSFKLLSNYVYYDVSDSGTIFVFKNGTLLENTIDYTYSDGYINFTESVKDTDDILIGVNSYNMLQNSSTITTDLPNVNEDILVHVSGVVQEPEDSYLINGSTITLQKTHELVTYDSVNGVYFSDQVFLYQVGTNSNDVQKMDYLDDNYTKSTYKLALNYKSFNPPSADDIFIIRNGVVQNPLEDFIVGSGYITFTTNITKDDQIFIMYTHGTEELNISSVTSISSEITRFDLGSYIDPSDYENIVVYADGTPRMYQRDDFKFGNTYIDLYHTPSIPPAHIFIVKYPSVTTIDEYDDCPNDSRTRFKLLYNNQNLVVSNTVSDADILISINGVVQHPGNQYILSSNRGYVDMSYAPKKNDEIFMVRMLGNEVRNLTPTGTQNQYTINIPETTQKENIVIFSNNTWKFAELGDFTWNNDSTITLSTPHTTGNLFGIKFYGVFNLLDQIHTPFNGTITKFNLFDNEENFVPVGTVANDNIPDETSLIVTKNNKFLEPKFDYSLSGDINSQIVLSTAPVSSDIISVRSVGSFLKLDTITNSSGTTFNLTLNGDDYYPNNNIGRPRQLENQIVVVVDGKVMSPIYDYYVYNNKVKFVSALSAFTRMFILDFQGTPEDVKVFNTFEQISVGDQIYITGEETPREVEKVLSPTLLKTKPYTGKGPGNFAANTTISAGKIQSINVTNSGLNFEDPIAIKTIGTGEGASFVGYTSQIFGGKYISDTQLYPGHNVYNNHEVYPSVYAYTYRKKQLSKSQVRKGTKLSSNINSTVESIPLANTFELPSNTPSVVVTSSSGSGASFTVYVSKGEIRKIDILNGGIGYDDRDLEVKISGGGGTGCVLEPTLDNNGTITNLEIRNSGNGYDTFRVIIHSVSGGIVNSEVIEYTHVTNTGIDGCTRGVLGTASSHNEDTIVYFDSYL